jgi:hypothetical protein
VEAPSLDVGVGVALKLQAGHLDVVVHSGEVEARVAVGHGGGGADAGAEHEGVEDAGVAELAAHVEGRLARGVGGGGVGAVVEEVLNEV